MSDLPTQSPHDHAHDSVDDRGAALRDSLSITEIRARLEQQSGQTFWRSLDELADTDEFQAFLRKEFPRHAAPLEGAMDRRQFVKLLGASLAMAGLAACARPTLPNEKIVPYVRQPEELTPSKPLLYATAYNHGGYAEGLLAESHTGRPTRVEGNRDHPASLGATAAVTQATVLQLYDPDRSQSVRERGQERSWGDLVAALDAALADLPQDGTGLRILTETITSPTLARQLAELLQRYPAAAWHQYDPRAAGGSLDGARLAFGSDVDTAYDFSAAAVVVSLDADFTDRGPGRLRYAKDFARRRRVRHADDDMNRLYLAEASPSPTGSIADHRFRLSPAAIAALANKLAFALGVDGATDTPLPEGVEADLFDAMVADLDAHRGGSIVIVGDEQPAVVHALAHAINAALDNVGSTVRYHEPVAARPENGLASLTALTTAMAAGEVALLVTIGANPVYTAPGDLDFAAALEQVPFTLHHGLYYDETAAASMWHAPLTHDLERWGDLRAFDGHATIQQPLILPFYGGRSEHSLLGALLGDAELTSYDAVQATWRNQVEGNFAEFWQRSVYAGVIAGSAAAAVEPTLQPFEISLPNDPLDFTLQLRSDPTVEDGRWANNGWLQELPKPFTKLTWDNAALISPADAERLGVRNEEHLTLVADGREVTAPAWILPGQAEKVVTLHLGYGRELAGRIGSGIGVDAYPLLSSTAGRTLPASVTVASGRTPLSDTQTHHALEGTGEARHIIRTGTLAEFRAHPDHPEFVHPVEHHESDLYPRYRYESYAWGMVVDMTVCTGCNACVSACQAENNIPIVGKDEVRIGREMHWIRVDHYYGGSIDDPTAYHMPMMCQHCEQAPCEPVCPVGATVHDHEGLNVMVYNRCVGTRYCSNNCPYKVRRFNYLQYAELDINQTELALANNPNVSMRSRGVMEKCTYCTQRIATARIDANNQERAIRDGEVVTACQAACPTEAIVFGDTNDPDSVVTQTKNSALNYALLEELNTQPRTTYLAKVTNPADGFADGGGH